MKLPKELQTGIYYIYLQGCGPCNATKPIIDTWVTMGYDVNIMLLNDFQAKYKDVQIRGGSPTLIINGSIIDGAVLSPLIQLYMMNFDFSTLNGSETLASYMTNFLLKSIDKPKSK